jgi:hypothetical protein
VHRSVFTVVVDSAQWFDPGHDYPALDDLAALARAVVDQGATATVQQAGRINQQTVTVRLEQSEALAQRLGIAQPETLTFTGFGSVQLTYEQLTVSSEAEGVEGEVLAVWDQPQNAWVIAANRDRFPHAAAYNGQVFSDVIISPEPSLPPDRTS